MNLFAQYKQEAQLAEAEYDNKPKKSEVPAIIRKKQDPKNWKLTLNDLETERTSSLSQLKPLPAGNPKMKTEGVGRLTSTITPSGTSVTSSTGRIGATITPGTAGTSIKPAAPKDSLNLKIDKTLPSASSSGDAGSDAADRAAEVKRRSANRSSSATYGESYVAKAATSSVKKHFDNWMNSEDAPRDDEAGDDNAVNKKAMRHLSGTSVPKEHRDAMAQKMTDKFHGINESASYSEYIEAAMIRFGVDSISELSEDDASVFLAQIDEAYDRQDIDYITKAHQHLAIMEQINLELGDSNIVGITFDDNSNYVVDVKKDDIIIQHHYQLDK